MGTYPLAKGKLEKARHKGDYGYAAHIPHRLMAMRQGLAGDGYGYGKRHCPHIERQVLGGDYTLVERGHEITHKPCKEEGHNEQGKHLVDDDHEGGKEGETGLGMCHWQEQGAEQRHDEIDDDGVGRGGCRVATQLLGDNGACGGGGTDDGKHESLDYHPRT